MKVLKMLGLKIQNNNKKEIKHNELGKDQVPSASAYVNTIRKMYHRPVINDGDRMVPIYQKLTNNKKYILKYFYLLFISYLLHIIHSQ